MLWPDQPEFLQLFSNEGPVTVNVLTSNKKLVSKMSMHWEEINRIFDPETNTPYQFMYFDTYRGSITSYEIDPVKNMLTIFVGKID
jgi:hypothetical protein